MEAEVRGFKREEEFGLRGQKLVENLVTITFQLTFAAANASELLLLCLLECVCMMVS